MSVAKPQSGAEIALLALLAVLETERNPTVTKDDAFWNRKKEAVAAAHQAIQVLSLEAEMDACPICDGGYVATSDGGEERCGVCDSLHSELMELV